MNIKKIASIWLKIGEISYILAVFTSLAIILLQCSNAPLIILSCIFVFSLTLFERITKLKPELQIPFDTCVSLRKNVLNIDNQIGFPLSLVLIVVNLFVDWPTFPNNTFQTKHLVTITLLLVSILSGFLTGKILRKREFLNLQHVP